MPRPDRFISRNDALPVVKNAFYETKGMCLVSSESLHCAIQASQQRTEPFGLNVDHLCVLKRDVSEIFSLHFSV
jgi:hypothetical protein